MHPQIRLSLQDASDLVDIQRPNFVADLLGRPIERSEVPDLANLITPQGVRTRFNDPCLIRVVFPQTCNQQIGHAGSPVVSRIIHDGRIPFLERSVRSRQIT